MSDVRRFDHIERVVRDERRRLDDVQSTTMSRLATHTHDDRYYTETESDGRYYTKTESNTLLAGKSNMGHIHSSSGLVAFESAVSAAVDVEDLRAALLNYIDALWESTT